jgi:2-keto-4-pentenoate hydratase/2-oxohepta-3-ene-1,7-dioic acid hydratase in catechol pathway
MKIFCIGRNYAEHAKELNNPVPTGEPLIFMKPNTALLVNNKPIYYPDYTKDLHYEGEIVLRVAKNGRSVEPEFASRYYDAVAFGIDFTARDIQDRLKSIPGKSPKDSTARHRSVSGCRWKTSRIWPISISN